MTPAIRWAREPGDLLWPGRYTQEVLDDRRREMGDYEFALQFQQSPIPLQGGLIRVVLLSKALPPKGRCRNYIRTSIWMRHYESLAIGPSFRLSTGRTWRRLRALFQSMMFFISTAVSVT